MYAQTLEVSDLDGTTVAYNAARFYARAKRAQVALIREWARRELEQGSSVAFHAMHPGWATAPAAEVCSGRLFLDREPRSFDRVPWTRLSAKDRHALWDEVVRRTGGHDLALT